MKNKSHLVFRLLKIKETKLILEKIKIKFGLKRERVMRYSPLKPMQKTLAQEKLFGRENSLNDRHEKPNE